MLEEGSEYAFVQIALVMFYVIIANIWRYISNSYMARR